MDNIKIMADAYKYRKAVESETVEVEENGIKVVIGGDLKIRELIMNDSSNSEAVKNVMNNAIRKAQEMMVMKMKEIVDLNNIT